MDGAGANVSVGSIAADTRCQHDVRYSPNSDHRATYEPSRPKRTLVAQACSRHGSCKGFSRAFRQMRLAGLWRVPEWPLSPPVLLVGAQVIAEYERISREPIEAAGKSMNLESTVEHKV
jgi:hypothetical protein